MTLKEIDAAAMMHAPITRGGIPYKRIMRIELVYASAEQIRIGAKRKTARIELEDIHGNSSTWVSDIENITSDDFIEEVAKL